MKKLMTMCYVAMFATISTTAATQKDGDYTWYYRIVGNTAEIYNSINSAAISPNPTNAVTIPPHARRQARDEHRELCVL